MVWLTELKGFLIVILLNMLSVLLCIIVAMGVDQMEISSKCCLHRQACCKRAKTEAFSDDYFICVDCLR